MLTLDAPGARVTVPFARAPAERQVEVTLSWDGRNASARQVDVHMGAFVETVHGVRRVLQPLGPALGSTAAAPWIEIDPRREVSGTVALRRMTIMRPDQIQRALLFAFVYGGTLDLDQMSASMRIRRRNGEDVLVDATGPHRRRPWWGAVTLASTSDGLEVVRSDRYFRRGSQADDYYGYGFDWRAPTRREVSPTR